MKHALTRRSFLGSVGLGLLASACGVEASGQGPDATPGGRGSGGPGVPDPGGASGEVPGAPSTAGPSQPPGPSAPPPPRAEGLPESLRFPLGVAAGDALTHGALLWTRYTGSAPLELVLWEESGAERPGIAVTPDDAGYVTLDVAGLTPGARYRYAFVELEGETRARRSPAGAFRTALDEGAVEPLTFGAVACNGLGKPALPLAQAAKANLDLFLFLGDTTYCDGAVTLDEFRGKWAENLTKASFQALRSATSLLATWDDHEITDDYDPETLAPEVFAAAHRAFFEHQPLRRLAGAPERLWRSRRWGRTAEFFLLDGRSERKPSTRGRADATYLSRAQLDWLKAGLAASIETEAIGGVLWVSGDFHLGSIGRVSTSGAGARALEVLAGPGDQPGNPIVGSLREPQFDFATGTSNYTRFELDPVRRAVTVTFVDGQGQELVKKRYAL